MNGRDPDAPCPLEGRLAVSLGVIDGRVVIVKY